VGFDFRSSKNPQAEQAAEKIAYFVIPSGARNLSSIQAEEKKERFLAPLGMKKAWGTFSAACKACATNPQLIFEAHPNSAPRPFGYN
jgi:hypothetical protein